MYGVYKVGAFWAQGSYFDLGSSCASLLALAVTAQGQTLTPSCTASAHLCVPKCHCQASASPKLGLEMGMKG